MKIEEILRNALDADTSDIFLIAGLPLTFKCNGVQKRIGENPLHPDEIEDLVKQIYVFAKRETTNLDKHIDDDFSFSISQFGRFRVNRRPWRQNLIAIENLASAIDCQFRHDCSLSLTVFLKNHPACKWSVTVYIIQRAPKKTNTLILLKIFLFCFL